MHVDLSQSSGLENVPDARTGIPFAKLTCQTSSYRTRVLIQGGLLCLKSQLTGVNGYPADTIG